MLNEYKESRRQSTRCLAGYGIKNAHLIFKSEMFIRHQEGNLNVKISFRKIIQFIDQEICKMLVRVLHGNENSTLHFGP